jgi:hypothetical protein
MADALIRKARVIGFYLPQYHPIPENDEWWGPGFTEWRNVARARPMFSDHYQPRIPADLGFYDLRLPEVRQAQAELASTHGLEAFCYWHYWFAGRRVLERPFTEVLQSKQPDFPFCLGWANESWTGIWHGLRDKILIEQIYPGAGDYVAHFYALLRLSRMPGTSPWMASLSSMSIAPARSPTRGSSRTSGASLRSGRASRVCILSARAAPTGTRIRCCG